MVMILIGKIKENCPLEEVQKLDKEMNLSIKEYDRHHNTALHIAASLGRLDLVKWLVNEKQASIEALNRKDQTPLYLAVDYGYIEVIEFLLSKNAKVDQSKLTDEGKTPLSKAMEKLSDGLKKDDIKTVQHYTKIAELLNEKNARLIINEKDLVTELINIPLYFPTDKAINEPKYLILLTKLLKNYIKQIRPIDELDVSKNLIKLAKEIDDIRVRKLVLESEKFSIKFTQEGFPIGYLLMYHFFAKKPQRKNFSKLEEIVKEGTKDFASFIDKYEQLSIHFCFLQNAFTNTYPLNTASEKSAYPNHIKQIEDIFLHSAQLCGIDLFNGEERQKMRTWHSLPKTEQKEAVVTVIISFFNRLLSLAERGSQFITLLEQDKLPFSMAKKMKILHDQGWNFEQIQSMFYLLATKENTPSQLARVSKKSFVKELEQGMIAERVGLPKEIINIIIGRAMETQLQELNLKPSQAVSITEALSITTSNTGHQNDSMLAKKERLLDKLIELNRNREIRTNVNAHSI